MAGRLGSRAKRQIKDELWEEQAGRCCYCGCQMRTEPPFGTARATIEHLTPKAQGGSNKRENLALACERCNFQRGQLTGRRGQKLAGATRRNYGLYLDRIEADHGHRSVKGLRPAGISYGFQPSRINRRARLFSLDAIDARVYTSCMNSDQFLRYLAKQGATINRKGGKGGHVEVKLGNRITFVPTHGGSKQLKTGLMRGIKKQLGIED